MHLLMLSMAATRMEVMEHVTIAALLVSTFLYESYLLHVTLHGTSIVQYKKY